MSRIVLGLVASLLLAPLLAHAAAAADPYPRLAGILIGSPQNYWDPAYQQKMAKLDAVILSVYPGWGSSQKTDMVKAVAQIKALNPKTRVFLYVIGESMKYPVSAAWVDLGQKVDQQKWWLYQTSSGPNLVLSDFGHETYVMNMTPYAATDSSGLKFNAWFAKYVSAQFATPNPLVDGFFTDNVFWKPRRDGDWNRDGKIDSQNDKTVQGWYRQGYADYYKVLKAQMPGKLQIANVADWGDPQAVAPEYQGMVNGGVMEGIVGKSYSIETLTGGWGLMMARYRKTMAMFATPKLGFFNQGGTPTDYQSMRYGLTSCLMDDGYYAFDDDSKGYSGVVWFDEFDADLGQSTSQPALSPWQKGVYRRDFEKGIALVNPRGNGTQEVTLEGDFYLIKGTQAPSVNTGALVRKVTVKDRDGLILLRQTPVKRPMPPQSILNTSTN